MRCHWSYGGAVLCGGGFAQRDSQCRGGKSACHHGAGSGESESGTAGTGSNGTGKPAGRAEVLGEVRRGLTTRNLCISQKKVYTILCKMEIDVAGILCYTKEANYLLRKVMLDLIIRNERKIK